MLNWKLVGGAFLFASSLFASTATVCQVDGVSQSDPSACSVTASGITAQATALLNASLSGNQFTLSIASDISITSSSIGPSIVSLATGANPASASAVANQSFTLPESASTDMYKVSLSTYQSGGQGVGPTPTGFPISGCSPIFDGEQCSFTLAASQLSTFTVGTDMAISYPNFNDMGPYFDAQSINMSISQFNAAGNPVDFTSTPEPATLGLTLCALAAGAFIIRRKVARTR